MENAPLSLIVLIVVMLFPGTILIRSELTVLMHRRQITNVLGLCGLSIDQFDYYSYRSKYLSFTKRYTVTYQKDSDPHEQFVCEIDSFHDIKLISGVFPPDLMSKTKI